MSRLCCSTVCNTKCWNCQKGQTGTLSIKYNNDTGITSYDHLSWSVSYNWTTTWSGQLQLRRDKSIFKAKFEYIYEKFFVFVFLNYCHSRISFVNTLKPNAFLAFRATIAFCISSYLIFLDHFQNQRSELVFNQRRRNQNNPLKKKNSFVEYL